MNYNNFMQFYYSFLNNTQIYNRFINHIAFYGSSVPYAIIGNEPPTTSNGRKRIVKDIDTYVKAEMLKEFRDYLLSLDDFNIKSDSNSLFRKDID